MSDSIVFYVNGQKQSVATAQESTLLIDYLRDDLGLTGTKNGCKTGHCGACTVLVDGKPKRACITKLSMLSDKRVLTIEGLSAHGKLHPVQRAFLDVGAIQCGFCTPGMILTAVALLEANPHPAKAEIMRALDRNICRCTGYVKIIEAVELAARYMAEGDLSPAALDRGTAARREMLPETGALESTYIMTEDAETVERPETDSVGGAVWDADGVGKATGTLQYADDLSVPGMVYGAFVFAGVPHAKVNGIDVSEAMKADGVIAVVTAKDVPGVNGYGILKQDQPVFCDVETKFCRDAVALVVAETEKAAREAVPLVKVDLAPLPAVLDMEAALAAGDIIKELGTTVGDVAAAKTEPGIIAVRGRFTTPYQEHACMETECALAVWNEKDGLNIVATTQSIFEVRRNLAKILGEAEERIRVSARMLGGGFGSKADLAVEAAAAVAARTVLRPVKITLSREESLGLSTKRHPYKMDYEIGVGRDGLLRYFEAELLSDGGPYTNLSPRVIDQACLFSVGPYRMPNGRVWGRVVRTNNIPCGAFRGFGINQSNFAMESLIDEAARKIGMDPFELRLKNAFVPGDATVSGEILRNSVGILPALRLCREATDKAYSVLKQNYPKGDRVLGVGMAAGFKNVGAGKGKVDDAGAIYTVLPDGRIELRVSGVDMGQGFRTAMRQLAAETLGLPLEEITEINGDTLLTHHHANAVGERQTLINGSAVVEAGKRFNAEIAEALRTAASKPLSGSSCEDRVKLAGKSVSYHYASPRTFPLDDVEGKASVPPEEYRNYPGYAYVAQSAIVEVDKATGSVRVLRVIAAHDLGRVINRHVVEGQLEGSCSMAIGYALTEHFAIKDGYLETKHIGALGLPKASDTPEYELLLIENPNPDGPFGAKGCSEVATVPMTAAVTNAIYDACGVRIYDLPATPDRILAGLK